MREPDKQEDPHLSDCEVPAQQAHGLDRLTLSLRSRREQLHFSSQEYLDNYHQIQGMNMCVLFSSLASETHRAITYQGRALQRFLPDGSLVQGWYGTSITPHGGGSSVGSSTGRESMKSPACTTNPVIAESMMEHTGSTATMATAAQEDGHVHLQQEALTGLFHAEHSPKQKTAAISKEHVKVDVRNITALILPVGELEPLPGTAEVGRDNAKLAEISRVAEDHQASTEGSDRMGVSHTMVTKEGRANAKMTEEVRGQAQSSGRCVQEVQHGGVHGEGAHLGGDVNDHAQEGRLQEVHGPASDQRVQGVQYGGVHGEGVHLGGDQQLQVGVPVYKVSNIKYRGEELKQMDDYLQKSANKGDDALLVKTAADIRHMEFVSIQNQTEHHLTEHEHSIVKRVSDPGQAEAKEEDVVSVSMDEGPLCTREGPCPSRATGWSPS